MSPEMLSMWQELLCSDKNIDNVNNVNRWHMDFCLVK